MTIADSSASAKKMAVPTAKARLAISCSVLALLAASAFETAQAQTQSGNSIETVTVTAEKRPENVQSVGASITAFSGDFLEENNITNFRDVASITPDLQVYSSLGTRQTTISLRDFGTNGTNPGLQPDVGLFIDGVYMPAASNMLNDIVDLSTVEVLRGPQGTLQGRNTPVGAVVVTTRAPTQDFEAEGDVEFGNYDERRFTGYIGGGITDGLAGRLTFWSDSHSGYLRDIATGTDVETEDTWGVRGRVRWTIDDRTTVDVIAYYEKQRYDGFYAGLANPNAEGGIVGQIGTPTASYGAGSTFSIVPTWNAQYPSTPLRLTGAFQTDDQNQGVFDTNESKGASVEVNHELPFDATITNIVAFNRVADEAVYPSGLPIVSTINFSPDNWSSESDELRVVSSGDHFLDYVGGIYLYHQDLFVPDWISWTSAANSFIASGVTPGQGFFTGVNTTENDAAVYAQLTGHITDSLRVIVGGRKSWDHTRGRISQYSFEPDGTTCQPAGPGEPSCTFENAIGKPIHGPSVPISDDRLTGTATVQYDITKDVMAYYTMANGFKDGGFAIQQVTPVLPESSTNYEIGVKSLFFDRRLLLNADVYRMILVDLQQSALAPGAVSISTYNAGKIRQTGVEADSQWNPIDELSLNAHLAYIDATYASYPNAQCIAGYPFTGAVIPAGLPQKNTSGPYTGACNQTGFTPPNSPRWKWSVGAKWEQPISSTLDWFVQGNVHGISDQNLTLTLDPRADQPGYKLVDANLGVNSEDGRWKIQLYGRNLTDQAYFQALTSTSTTGFSVGGKTPNGWRGYWGQPRTFGIEASFKY